MMDAIRDAGFQEGDSVTQHYYPDEGKIVIDLGGGQDVTAD